MKIKDNILKVFMLGGALCMSVAGLLLSMNKIVKTNVLKINSRDSVVQRDSATAFTGRGAPSSTNGKDGDSYVDLNTMDIYFKQNGQWVKQGNANGENGVNGLGIVSITLTSTSADKDVYTITYSDGSTTSFEVTFGTTGQPGAKGLPGEDGHTPTVVIGSNGNWFIDGRDSGIHATGPKGDKGDQGKSILAIFPISRNHGVTVYSIFYSDGSTDSFTIQDGVDGNQGIQGLPGENGYTPVITIGSNGHWFIDGEDTGITARGPKGEKGEQGNSIVSIEKISTSGNVDTYRITYSDGTTSTFTVTNGENGDQGIQGIQGEDGYTPQVTIGTDGNWYVDGVDTGIPTCGDKGDKGDNGDKGDQGTYVTSCEINSNGHLIVHFSDGTSVDAGAVREEDTCSVTWHYAANYKSTLATTVLKGSAVIQPTSIKASTGHLYKWSYYNHGIKTEWKNKAFTINEDLHLYGDEIKERYEVHLDPNGGALDETVMTFEYGDPYTLHIPTAPAGKTFIGWVYNQRYGYTINNTGTWTYTYEQYRNLKALWGWPVTLDPREGTCATTSMIMGPGMSVSNIPHATPPTGYVFDGWYMPLEDERMPAYIRYETVPQNATGDYVYARYYAQYIETYVSGGNKYNLAVKSDNDATRRDYYIPSLYQGYEVLYLSSTPMFSTRNIYIEGGAVSFNVTEANGVEELVYTGLDNPWSDKTLFIGRYAFGRSSMQLRRAILPNNCETIKYKAFYGCRYLAYFEVGTGLKSIEEDAFYYAGSSVTDFTIKYRGTKAQWDAIEKHQNWRRYTNFKLICTDGTFTLGPHD